MKKCFLLFLLVLLGFGVAQSQVVPPANSTANNFTTQVVGNKLDTADGTVGNTNSIMRYVKYLVTTSGGLGSTLGGIDDVVTSTLHGKIGTDTEMADASFYDLLFGTGVSAITGLATWPNAIVAGTANASIASAIRFIANMQGASDGATTESIQGKIGTDTEMADASLWDLFFGPGTGATAGVAAWPAAAVPGTANASVLQGLLYMHNEIGIPTAADSDSVNGKLGTDANYADVSLFDQLLGAGGAGNGIPAWPGAAAPAANISVAQVISHNNAYLATSATLLGTVDLTTTDNVHGKIGTDAEMLDASLWDVLVGDSSTAADGIAVWPDSVVPGTANASYVAGFRFLCDLIGVVGIASGWSAGVCPEAGDVNVGGMEALAWVADMVGNTASAGGTVPVGALSITSDSLHGKMGTDTQYADTSLFGYLLGPGGATGAGYIAFPAPLDPDTAGAGTEVSIGNAIHDLDDVIDTLTPGEIIGDMDMDVSEADFLTTYVLVMTIAPNATATDQTTDVVIDFDWDHGVGGWNDVAANNDTIDIYVATNTDGLAPRFVMAGTQVVANGAPNTLGQLVNGQRFVLNTIPDPTAAAIDWTAAPYNNSSDNAAPKVASIFIFIKSGVAEAAVDGAIPFRITYRGATPVVCVRAA